MEWFKKHWSNAVTLGCIFIAAFIEAWQQAAMNVPSSVFIPRLQGFWRYIPLILLIAAGAVWLTTRKQKTESLQVREPQSPALVPGIPTLSALLGQEPKINVDAATFFARAYFSPLTAEAENNIRVVAQRYWPKEKEAFYARLIGTGLISYQHDVTWLTIYGSQLAALAELNSRGLVPVADLKKHYDKAVAKYPNVYANYSFDQWVIFMKSRMLVATYQSGMVELSHLGKDFLKYLAHVGMDTHAKTN